jgi:hypothetical protein
LLLILPTAARCDLVFSVAQVNSGPIALGSDATFDLFVRSTTANQSFISVFARLELGTTNGAGGRFATAGATSELSGFWYLEDFLAEYDGAPNAQISSLGLNNTKIASFVLSTSGATEGTYELNFTLTAGVASLTQNLDTSGVSTTYIIGVPEPSSIALVGVAGVGAFWGYRRRTQLGMKFDHRSS